MYVRRPSLALSAALFLALNAPAFAQGPESKIDRGLRATLINGAPTQKVIVTVNPGCRDFVRSALQNHGDRIKAEHPIINAISVDLHSEDVQELAQNSCVKTLSYDAPVSAKGGPQTSNTLSPSRGATRALATTNTGTGADVLRTTLGLPAAPTRSTPTGAGVTVAVIDSGIAPNDDFSGRISAFYDFTKGGIPTTPYDDYGHGTHVAGLIGSSGKLSNGVYMGVAPGVHFVGLKVLDGTGSGTTSDVIKALDYVIANKNLLRVQVVNLSVGHPIYAPAKDDPLVQAVEQASAAGIIVVTAAGNYGLNQKGSGSGYTGITSPGNAPSAITSGAAMTQATVTRLDDVVAPYSSRGPTWFDAFAKPNLVAPGHGLVSDALTSSYLYASLPANRTKANGNAFLSLSGTSMAAGVTSGVVALMVEAHNGAGFWDAKPLTANLAKAMLEYSAIAVAGADYLTQGSGEINAAGAVALARSIDTGLPGYWQVQPLSESSVIGGDTYAWSRQVIYGSDVLSGNVVYTNNIVWGTNIVWNDRLVGQMDDSGNIVWGTAADAENIVWGTLNAQNIVWGTVVSPTNIVWGTTVDENIVWGTVDENVVWGTGLGPGSGTIY